MAGDVPSYSNREKFYSTRTHFIVREELGRGTGESVAIDEQGTRWSQVPYLPPPNTGDRQGIRTGRLIHEL